MSLNSPSPALRHFSKVVTFRLCRGLFLLSPFLKLGAMDTVTSGKSSPDNSVLEKDFLHTHKTQNIILHMPSNDDKLSIFLLKKERFFFCFNNLRCAPQTLHLHACR